MSCPARSTGISKALFCLAVMRLVDAGEIDRDAEISLRILRGELLIGLEGYRSFAAQLRGNGSVASALKLVAHDLQECDLNR